MSFLNPILLAGLGAVAVPILIHLWNRRRFRKVVWAAMRFLQISVERNRRRMQIEDMILLGLRCLLLVLLALALARPALRSSVPNWLGRSKVTAVLVLDNSYSMGMSDGATTRLDKARRAAEQVLDTLPAGSATALLLASDVVQPVISEPTFDLHLARKLVREAPRVDRGTELLQALSRAVDLLKNRLAARREIYLITDGQAVGWRQFEEIRKLLEQWRHEIPMHVILVSEHETQNLGVSDLRLASGLAPLRHPLRFEAKVTNYGQDEARHTRVSLSVNDAPPGDELTIDALPPGASRSVSLFAKLGADGFHAIRARIPEDRLRADDHRTVVVRAIQEVKVLLVEGESGQDARDRPAFFLQHAFTPVPREQAADYFIQTKTVNALELATARLDDFDAIVFANVREVPEATSLALHAYLRRGGGVMVFPGAKLNPAFYNEQWLKRFNFLPAAFGSTRGQEDQEARFFTLQDKDYQHSIASLWNEPAAGTLASARFFRVFELIAAPAPQTSAAPDRSGSPPDEAGLPQVVLRFAEGEPAVMERPWGLGRVIQFSSTADTSWNDWPVRPSFVPWLHRALGALVQRQDEGLNVRVGERFVRRVGSDFLHQDATFARLEAAEATRELRRVELVNGWPAVQYERTDFAGVYEARIAMPPLALQFAAQPDPTESSLDELSPSQLDLLKSVANVVEWTPDFALKSVVEQQRSGTEFWLPLAVAALLVGLVETFLGQWFSRAK
jgi:hypothetical protein